MSEIVARFEPLHGWMTTTLLVCLLLLVAAGLFIFFNQRRRPADKGARNLRNLLTMLAGFVAVAALGFAGFEALLQSRIRPVVLYTDGMDLPKGHVPFKVVRKIYLYRSPGERNLTGQTKSRGTQMLVVEQSNGQFHYLMERDYPVREMVGMMQRQLKAYGERK